MSKPTHSPTVEPARHHFTILGQMLKFIPRSILSGAAAESGVDTKARTFSVLSHLGTMVFVQLAHALSLNDVCDWLRLKARAIAAFGLTPPSRNNLSHANKVRDAKFARAGVLAHVGASAAVRAGLWPAASWRWQSVSASPFQSEHSCGGLDGDGAGG